MSGAATGDKAVNPTCRIGVDIGGTFTDIVLARSDGRLFVLKASSSTREPEQAVVAGVAAILGLAGLPVASVREVLHGTTVGSNTILQKSGARTGLITTRGFRDVLEIGRVRTPDLFDLQWDKPEPLVRRRHRLEVRERLHADGSVATALDEADAARAADALVAGGIEAIALCFLHSYRNPAHERRAMELVRARHPGVAVCASIDILPEMKEYERTSTTVVNAYILPTMRRYLERLQGGLATLGVDCPLLVVTSNGGLARAPLAMERPVFFIGSGPAAGVVGAARLAAAAGCADAIAFDMGGTTAKASLIDNGAVARTNEYEFRAGISTPSRFIKAGGYMLKVPAVDVAEVGAGAGSIAWVDPAGLLHVGPQSAGGDPGPACYGKGGDRATVSDANVALGMLNPHHLAGGALQVHRDLAVAAIERDVARPLGVDVMQAALGIRSVANASMARAVRSVTVERGIDPRDFTLVAFGGSGPVHAARSRRWPVPKHAVPSPTCSGRRWPPWPRRASSASWRRCGWKPICASPARTARSAFSSRPRTAARPVRPPSPPASTTPTSRCTAIASTSRWSWPTCAPSPSAIGRSGSTSPPPARRRPRALRPSRAARASRAVVAMSRSPSSPGMRSGPTGGRDR